MLRAVREEGFDRLYKEKLALFEKMRGDPFGYLRDGSYAYVRFAVDNPTLYRLMLAPPPKLEVSGDPWASEAGSKILNLLLACLRSTQEEGYLPGIDLKRYSFMYGSAVNGALSFILQNREMEKSARWDASREAIDTLMDVIAATRSVERSSS